MATARTGRVLEDEATALAMAQEVLRSFEEDFARQLHREGQLLRVTAALLGFTVCGALTFLGSAALPVLSIGPVKVAFGSALGAFGGSHWAARSSELETRRQGVAKSWEVGANSLVAIAGSFPPKPTIRRLKRIVKWAHQLLARPGALSGDWRVAVFLEVACGFAPWAQRAYFERQKSTVESRSQSLRHLLPLYRFLQRSATAQVAVELCSSLAARRASSSTQDGEREGFQGPPKSSSAGTPGDADYGDGDRDRRCLALAIVLQTITALDSLDDMTYDRLAKGLDLNKESATFCSSWMSTKRRSAAGRRQLQHILRSGRAVLRPLEIRETLTSIPPMVLPGDIEVEEELGDEDAEFVSITDSVREDLEGSGYVQRRAEFHKGTGEHSWGLTDPWNYKLRSLSYFEDGSKIPSGPAMLELIDVDVSRISALGPIFESAKHSDFSYQALRRQGDARFLWIWNLVLPPYQAVLTAALDPAAAWLQNDMCPQGLVWRRFLAADSEERKAKLKVIFSVEVGPWVLKKVAIKKPTLIGKKLSMASYYVPEDYIEITMDVTNGGKGGGYEEMVTGMVLRHVKSLECSVCCLLEATEQDELPECALFAAHFSHVDFGKMRMMTAI